MKYYRNGQFRSEFDFRTVTLSQQKRYRDLFYIVIIVVSSLNLATLKTSKSQKLSSSGKLGFARFLS